MRVTYRLLVRTGKKEVRAHRGSRFAEQGSEWGRTYFRACYEEEEEIDDMRSFLSALSLRKKGAGRT